MNFTLNFSKPASHIIAQYYQMIRLGRKGYQAIMTNLTHTADYLTNRLTELGFIIMSDGGGHGLPVVAFRLSPAQHILFDEFALSHKLRERGWIVPAYTMAADCEKMSMMRVVVREDFSQSRCDSLVHDIQFALQTLAQRELYNIQRYQTQVFGSSGYISLLTFLTSLLQNHIIAPKRLCNEQACPQLITLTKEKAPSVHVNERECVDA